MDRGTAGSLRNYYGTLYRSDYESQDEDTHNVTHLANMAIAAAHCSPA
jgi:hypothetical protein